MELYLIRHGQSVNNALFDDVQLRVSDPDLTDLGWKQAEQAAEHLAQAMNPDEFVPLGADALERKTHIPYRFTHLYCSPMRRAIQTAQPLAKALGLKPEIHPAVHEIGGIFLERDGIMTGYGGMSREAIVRDFPDTIIPEAITESGWYDVRIGKESNAIGMGRAIHFAYEMQQRGTKLEASDESIIVVSHAGFMSFFLKAVMNTLPSFTYLLTHHNTGITRISYKPDYPTRIMYINRIQHLPPEMVT